MRGKLAEIPGRLWKTAKALHLSGRAIISGSHEEIGSVQNVWVSIHDLGRTLAIQTEAFTLREPEVPGTWKFFHLILGKCG
jgi:hypothetical protein